VWAAAYARILASVAATSVLVTKLKTLESGASGQAVLRASRARLKSVALRSSTSSK
jgi:hypothetical protein